MGSDLATPIWAIALIVLGSLLGFIIVLVILFCICRHCALKREFVRASSIAEWRASILNVKIERPLGRVH